MPLSLEETEKLAEALGVPSYEEAVSTFPDMKASCGRERPLSIKAGTLIWYHRGQAGRILIRKDGNQRSIYVVTREPDGSVALDRTSMANLIRSSVPLAYCADLRVLAALGKKNPNEPEWGFGTGRFPRKELKSAGEVAFDKAKDTVGDIAGDWHKRNKYPLPGEGVSVISLFRGAAEDRELQKWLDERLRRLGYRRGRYIGSGSWGAVFALDHLSGAPSGLVLKVTTDASEVAATHRLMQSGIKSAALPAVVGAWGGAPGGLWFIIREDVAKTCKNRPSPQLCAVLDYLSDVAPDLFWSNRKPGGKGLKLRQALKLRDKALVNRLIKELRRIKRVTGVSFIDIKSDNVRLREADHKKHLVVTDFGFSSGPAVRVPLAANNPERQPVLEWIFDRHAREVRRYVHHLGKIGIVEKRLTRRGETFDAYLSTKSHPQWLASFSNSREAMVWLENEHLLSDMEKLGAVKGEKNPRVRRNSTEELRKIYKNLRARAVRYSTPNRPMSYIGFDEAVQRRANTIVGGLDERGWVSLAKEVHDEQKARWERNRKLRSV